MLASRVEQSSRKRPRDPPPRELCPHCDQNLNIKTFKKHKTLFCRSDGTWVKDDVQASDAVDTDADADESKFSS